MTTIPLRYGVFMSPYHPENENPTMCFQRDMELIEHLDKLGYAEAWIGEHHSAGFETISSPELFIAAVAERTKYIKLGTGVVSLPYHNPLMVADRIIQLDHQTKGRIMFGVGPGLLVTDADMLGIDPKTQRDRMMQALDVIVRLFKGETVTEKTDWYTLNKARCHLLPYTYPHPELAVASALTPSGGRAAGKYDAGMLCLAATDTQGFDVLGTNWQVAVDVAATYGRKMDRSRLRLMAPIHIAETREQARKNCEFGLKKFIDYYGLIATKALVGVDGDDPVDIMLKSGRAVIGTPDDAIALIEKLQAKQGEFGCFMQQVHDWADTEQTKKSYELFARFVMPHFSKANRHREASLNDIRENVTDINFRRQQGVDAMFAKHAEGKPV